VGGYDILYGVSGTGASDVWAVGVTGYSHGLIAHWHGTSWTVAPHPQYAGGEEFRGVMAVAPSDAWAVGGKDLALEKPIIEHWDGVRWSDVQIPQVTLGGLLLGIDASGPDDVWAVGIGDGGALIYHWDGSIWTKLDNVPYGSTGEWWSVSSLAPNDVWVGGLKDQSGPPIASHWNGLRWTNTPTVSENKWFITIKAFSHVQVWAAGGGAGGIRVERLAGCG
jgi:hypothetical protein